MGIDWGREATVTTTDWTLLTVEKMAALANCGDCDVGADVAYLFDADDQASVELLCNTCGGAGQRSPCQGVPVPAQPRARSH